MVEKDAPLEVLEKIFANIVTWLQFAEAKNAALVTFNCAALVGLGTVAATLSALPCWMALVMCVAALAFACSLLCSFISFFPKVQQLGLVGIGSASTTGTNVWFYTDIANMGAGLFLKTLVEKGKFAAPTDLERDLANQIVINAEITLSKYQLFKIAIWILLGGLLLSIGASFIYWLLIGRATS